MKKGLKAGLALWTAALLLVIMLLPVTALAATDESYFTFEAATGTITGYNVAGGNDVDIPSTIGGTAVTAIGAHAFENMNTLTSVIIPEGVMSIGDYAFGGCDLIESMTLPSSLKTIGECALCGCSLHNGVTLPDGLTGLGEGAFAGCYSLRGITVPAGITEIADYTFGGCESLVSVTFLGNITRIGDYAFQNCLLSSVITLPDSLESIGEHAFSGSKLTAIAIPNSVDTIGTEAFSYCTRLQSITLPTGLTGISDSMFKSCWALNGITLPDNVTSIGEHAFEDCTSLEKIAIPTGVTRIENVTFYACSSLTDVSLPTGLTYIGDSAFCRCGSLTGITLPDTLVSIGFEAFRMTHLKTLVIPASVSSVGGDMLCSCSNLTGVYFQGDAPAVGSNFYGFFYGMSGSLKVYYLYDASGWTDVFQGCEAIALHFTVTGGAFGTDYTYANHALTFLRPGDYEVSMQGGLTDTDTDKIVVNASGSSAANPASITLNNVNIDLAGDCAFSVQGSSTAALSLTVTNTLQSGAGYAGLRVASGNSVSIGGSGTLIATGGNQGAGIGGSDGENGGSVTLTGGVVFAQGGSGAQDVGAEASGSGGTLNLSGTTALFLYHDDCLSPATSTHTHGAVDDTTDDMYGIANTPNWASPFGAWLRLCTLSFNANGGAGTLPDADTTLYGNEMTVPDGSGLSRSGYDYAGWNTQANGGGMPYAAGSRFTYDAATTLYAQWTPVPYSIGYDLDGGTVNTSNPTGYHIESGSITLNNPTKAGYVFTGWSGTGISGTSMSVTIPKGSTGNRSYTAHWTAVYTLTYDLDGGTISSANPASYTAESDSITLNNPTKAGYVFTGWSGTGITGKSTSVTIPYGSTGNREYTAHWDAVPASQEQRTLTDNPSGITISGIMNSDAVLTVNDITLGDDNASDAIRQRMDDNHYLLVFGKDISLSGGFTGTLSITVSVGSEYNGQQTTALHSINGVLETLTATVVNGQATFTVTSLSPFAVFVKAGSGLDDVPKTGDNSTNWVWWVLCGVSAAGIAALALWSKRKA